MTQSTFFARILLLVAIPFVTFSTCYAVEGTAGVASGATPRKEIYDTQELTLPRLTPSETAATAKKPDGFVVEVAAQDPDVQQPIGMCWDSRGRLWIVENYTYAEKERNFDLELNDRIIILEDKDRDGKFENRKVFWDEGKQLTSIEIGYGGVWAMAPPHLLFIPDRDNNDVPDAKPEVVLDGFENSSIRHNLANGLKWGPDGWLYGRHGIQAVSKVGVPGASDIERTEVSCSIWRVHPTRRAVDVVCRGTTNPWGHDWDQHGQLFFINTVIGHLWHAIPGAHLQRMYGEDADARVYELMGQIADHWHFDTANEKWADIRTLGITKTTDSLGGGHAQSGMMIYQGDQWPARYRNQLFTLNYHGRRINVERLDREGAGYVGRHEPDMVFFADPWFRGVEVSQGPDGSAYVLDWSDIGECHDNDGIHRHSGVVYRIRYGEPSSPALSKDLRTLSDAELLSSIASGNAWLARQSRLILAERSSAETIMPETWRSLIDILRNGTTEQERLSALWTLAGCSKDSSSILKTAMKDENEHVRIQSLQLAVDPSRPAQDITADILQMAQSETSDLVCLHIAGAMQRIRGKDWWPVMQALVDRKHLAKDRDYPLMLWYALMEGLSESPTDGIELIANIESKPSQLTYPKLVEFTARWIMSQMPREKQHAETLINAVLRKSPEYQAAATRGMLAGLLGRTRVSPPDNWSQLQALLAKHSDATIREASLQLGAIFGDGVANDQLAKIVEDNNATISARANALQAMADNNVPGTKELANKLVRDRYLSSVAIASYLQVAEIDDAKKLLPILVNGKPTEAMRKAILEGLVRKKEFIPVLFEAVEQGSLPADLVDAASLRQIQLLEDPKLNVTLGKLWPQTQLLGQEKVEQIRALESKLTPEMLSKAHLGRGRSTWNKLCASCHKLYGEGGLIGPELTGAQRTNLRYWTENVLDPSGTVAANFRVTLFLLDDGSIVTGVLLNEDESSVMVQTVKEKVRIEKKTIEHRKVSTQSLMPEGLLDALTDEQRRDLFGYLMSIRQVAPE